MLQRAKHPHSPMVWALASRLLGEWMSSAAAEQYSAGRALAATSSTRRAPSLQKFLDNHFATTRCVIAAVACRVCVRGPGVRCPRLAVAVSAAGLAFPASNADPCRVRAVVWWLCRKSAGRRLMRRGSISGVLVSSLGSFISKNESAVGPFVLTVARVVFPVDAAATMGTGNSNRSLGRTTSGSSLAYVEEEDVVFTDDETDDDDEDSDEEYAAAAAAAGDVGSGDVDAGGDVDGAVDRGDGASDATDEEARTDEMYGADVIVPGVFARAHRRRSASGDSDLSATPGIPSLHDDRAIQVTHVPLTAQAALA